MNSKKVAVLSLAELRTEFDQIRDSTADMDNNEKLEEIEPHRDVPAKYSSAAVPVNLELERLKKLNASLTAELAMKTRPWVNMKKCQSEVLYNYKGEEVASAPAEIDEDVDSVDVDTTSGGKSVTEKQMPQSATENDGLVEALMKEEVALKE